MSATQELYVALNDQKGTALQALRPFLKSGHVLFSRPLFDHPQLDLRWQSVLICAALWTAHRVLHKLQQMAKCSDWYSTLSADQGGARIAALCHLRAVRLGTVGKGSGKAYMRAVEVLVIVLAKLGPILLGISTDKSVQGRIFNSSCNVCTPACRLHQLRGGHKCMAVWA